MKVNVCAARSNSRTLGGSPHLTFASVPGFFGMGVKSTLCGRTVRKVYPELDISVVPCWQCRAELQRVQARAQNMSLLAQRIRSFIHFDDTATW